MHMATAPPVFCVFSVIYSIKYGLSGEGEERLPLLLSFLCSAGAGYLLADHFFLGGAWYAALPGFAPSACALTGLLIAGLEYRARKTKKQRRLPMLLLMLACLMGILTTGLWMYQLIRT